MSRNGSMRFGVAIMKDLGRLRENLIHATYSGVADVWEVRHWQRVRMGGYARRAPGTAMMSFKCYTQDIRCNGENVGSCGRAELAGWKLL